MLSLCKKEIQLQNLLKKIVNSEHKIYLLIQIVKFSNSEKMVDDLELLLLLLMSRGVSISCLTSPIWWNSSSGLSGHLQFVPWAAAFWKHFTLTLSCSTFVICPSQSSPSYRTKTYIHILYDTCCGSKATWYWTSQREDCQILRSKKTWAGKMNFA